MAYLGLVPASPGYSKIEKQTITGDGNTTYTLINAVANEQEIEVFVNNVRQEPGNAYTTFGTTLEMSGPVTANDSFYVVYQGKAERSLSIIPERDSKGHYNFDSGTLYIDSTNNRIGIGNTNPSQELTVTGNVSVSGNLTVGTSVFITANGNVGIGTTSPENQLHIQTTTATTNTVTSVLRLDSQSSSTPANGIGVALEFVAETAAGNPEIGATIEAISTDVTATSEDFDLSFKTMAAGAAAAERMRVTSAGNFQFDSGYGSVATGYGCRAWVNFNGTGTVAIRDSGNVSSITDNGTGDYTINFTNAMPDVNYNFTFGFSNQLSNIGANMKSAGSFTTSFSVQKYENNALTDISYVCVSIFR